MVGTYWISLPPEGELFNPYTGNPRYVWNRTPNGKIQLFPIGYQVDPIYGVHLGTLTSYVAKEYTKQSEERQKAQRARSAGAPPERVQQATVPPAVARKLNTRLPYDVLLRVERFENVDDETIVHVVALGERNSEATPLGPIGRTTYVADEDGNVYDLIRVTGSDGVRLVPETELYARLVRTSQGTTAYKTNNSIHKLRKDEVHRFALHFERIRTTSKTLSFRYSDSDPIILIRSVR